MVNQIKRFFAYRPPRSKRGTITMIIAVFIALSLCIYGYILLGSATPVNDSVHYTLMFIAIMALIIGMILDFIFTIKDNPDYFSKDESKKSYAIFSITCTVLLVVIVWCVPRLF